MSLVALHLAPLTSTCSEIVQKLPVALLKGVLPQANEKVGMRGGMSGATSDIHALTPGVVLIA